MTDFYAAAGVNVSLGDVFSARSKKICKETWNNSPYVVVTDHATHSFRGPVTHRFQNLPNDCEEMMGSDGVGTKVGIVTAAKAHATCGYDLMAMKAMDRTRWGGLPLVATNVLDVRTLGESEESPTFQAFVRLIEGMKNAADEIGVVITAGETAELGMFVGSEDPKALTMFNWSGSIIGAAHPNKMITGERMRPGHIVIALEDVGPRSNGISAIRKALALRFGSEWWANPDALPWIQAAATPCVLYDKFLCTMHGWHGSPRFEAMIEMFCIAHITGGGIPGKFFNDIVKPLGLSAELGDLFDPAPILRSTAEWYTIDGRSMPDRECYERFHGGQGALVVIDAADERRFIEHARNFGISAKACGRITETSTKPRLVINSKFCGEMLIYT